MPRRTPEELDAFAVIDPEINAILKSGKMPSLDIDYTDSQKAVEKLRALIEAWGGFNEREGVISTRSSYKTRDGHENSLLIFRPSAIGIDVKLPVIVQIHGGGGAIGTPESTSSFCQQLALDHDAVVLAPGYRLAPEHKFPIGRNDCADAVKYIAGHAGEHGGDPALGFILGGHSFGGSTATFISLHAEDLDLPAKLTGVYIGTGNLVDRHAPPEYVDQFRSRKDERCITAPILNAETKKLFEEAGASLRQPVWSGVCDDLVSDGFKRQPRTYLQVCGMDILRDDSLVYEDILKLNGVDTRLDIYPGTPHVFWSVFRSGTISQATKWAEETRVGISWLLGRQ